MAKNTKPKSSGTTKNSGASSQSFFIFLIGILSVGGIWLYGLPGFILSIYGVRYVQKRPKAAASFIGYAGKILSILALTISSFYLLAFAVTLIA
ncbi:MAG: hypothetical protein Q8928_19210 [Bacteroidota bacterium]|nr:hypothetical protein [Bacteroidota bacterium]